MPSRPNCRTELEAAKRQRILVIDGAMGTTIREYKAKGVLDETAARGTRFALITMDLIGVPRNVRLHVAEQVQKQFGIDPAHLAINASHTHSGPELRTSRVHGTDDPAQREVEASAYTDQLQNTLVRLVGEALQKAVPATLNYSKARCGFAMNSSGGPASGSPRCRSDSTASRR